MPQKTGNDVRDTVNAGPTPRRKDEGEFKIGGNVRQMGKDPSPDDRARGETSGKEKDAPVHR